MPAHYKRATAWQSPGLCPRPLLLKVGRICVWLSWGISSGMGVIYPISLCVIRRVQRKIVRLLLGQRGKNLAAKSSAMPGVEIGTSSLSAAMATVGIQKEWVNGSKNLEFSVNGALRNVFPKRFFAWKTVRLRCCFSISGPPMAQFHRAVRAGEAMRLPSVLIVRAWPRMSRPSFFGWASWLASIVFHKADIGPSIVYRSPALKHNHVFLRALGLSVPACVKPKRWRRLSRELFPIPMWIPCRMHFSRVSKH